MTEGKTSIHCPVRICDAGICYKFSGGIYYPFIILCRNQGCESDLHRSLNLHISKHHAPYQWHLVLSITFFCRRVQNGMVEGL